MINLNENETVENEVSDEYDYTNEEPFEEELDNEYDEEEHDYCD